MNELLTGDLGQIDPHPLGELATHQPRRCILAVRVDPRVRPQRVRGIIRIGAGLDRRVLLRNLAVTLRQLGGVDVKC